MSADNDRPIITGDEERAHAEYLRDLEESHNIPDFDNFEHELAYASGYAREYEREKAERREQAEEALEIEAGEGGELPASYYASSEQREALGPNRYHELNPQVSVAQMVGIMHNKVVTSASEALEQWADKKGLEITYQAGWENIRGCTMDDTEPFRIVSFRDRETYERVPGTFVTDRFQTTHLSTNFRTTVQNAFVAHDKYGQGSPKDSRHIKHLIDESRRLDRGQRQSQSRGEEISMNDQTPEQEQSFTFTREQLGKFITDAIETHRGLLTDSTERDWDGDALGNYQAAKDRTVEFMLEGRQARTTPDISLSGSKALCNLIDSCERAIQAEEKSYNSQYDHASWVNNNMPNVGQTEPYAEYPVMAKWVEPMKESLAEVRQERQQEIEQWQAQGPQSERIDVTRDELRQCLTEAVEMATGKQPYGGINREDAVDIAIEQFDERRRDQVKDIESPDLGPER